MKGGLCLIGAKRDVETQVVSEKRKKKYKANLVAAARSIHLNPTGSSYKAITYLQPFFALISDSAYGRLHANQVWKELIRPL